MSETMAGIGKASRNKKKGSHMAVNRLARLDGRKVAVEVLQSGQRKVLQGSAAFVTDQELGRHLKINVREVWGDFDFILREDQWDGEIFPGGSSGCDFQICLTADCVCAK